MPWTDIVEVVPAKDFSFSASGDPVPGPAPENLCVRAYDLLRQEFDLKPVAIHLHKCIPLGAGLGGGSADGAYALRTLNEIFTLSLGADQLRSLAARLGSDCPFFVEGKPAIGTGRGEVLSEIALSLKGKYLVIVRPEVVISTAKSYAGVTPRESSIELRDVLEHHPIEQWRQLLKNDFEDHVFKQFPIIEAIHQKLYALDALYASMSGSGSAVFGIFPSEVDLKRAFERLTYWSGYLD